MDRRKRNSDRKDDFFEGRYLRSELQSAAKGVNVGQEWKSWCLRVGIAPESKGPASLAGIYTDFS
jgi:hypothetical protein